MAKIEEIPNDKQFFTIADLVGQGLTISRIDKFVRDGRLIKHGNNIYENPDFQWKNEDDKKHPISVLSNERLMTFLPPLLMSDINGLERSVVHYVVPSQLDSLQLVQIGVQATAPSYQYGPSIRDHHLLHFMLKGSGEMMINDQSFLVNAGQIVYTPKGSQWYVKSDEENPWEYLWVGFCGKWADQLGLLFLHISFLSILPRRVNILLRSKHLDAASIPLGSFITSRKRRFGGDPGPGVQKGKTGVMSINSGNKAF